MPPVIRIEIERMKESLSVMLSEQATLISEEMQKAVDTFCTQDRIEKLVSEVAHRELESIVKDEITSFFRYGAGRKSIKASVQSKLNEMFEEKP